MTNITRVEDLATALLEANATPERVDLITQAVISTVSEEEAQARFQVAVADLTNNQRAWFVLERFRAFFKATIVDHRMRAETATLRGLRAAARARAEDGAL